MDIRDIKLFLALSETLHFRLTGEICNLSPSAVSRALQRMEQELGQELVHRETREISLTIAGRRFAEFCRSVGLQWSALQEELGTGANTLRGEVRIFASVTASIAILPRLLARLRAAFPEVRVLLQTGAPSEAIQRVADGVADIAVAALPDPLPGGLSAAPVQKTELELIAPRVQGAAGLTGGVADLVRPADLTGIPMVLPHSGLARNEILRWFTAAEPAVEPRIYAEVSGSEAIISMVRLGFGVGVVPRIVLDASALRQEVRLLRADPALEPFHLGLVVQTRRLHEPAVAALWSLREEY
ncbi:HTH-type transcriptional activator IlvY [Spirochaeta africana]|uniref:Transcriptional regulator n=1 Tax=Spirochaeta africana (strain ATCC 700263 / DSM 8902 / Z-7692) TaxID=889378 RepID=H9UHS3_SPIAZ|nr:HTH-type transcriptional activator IlvY [Spirochaeta africana]AFG37066.1 transcriptional regulator [Spirochaeta africana DSM 8902]